MKYILLYISFFPITLLGQQGLEFYSSYNAPIYLPFIDDVKAYKDSNRVTSFNFILGSKIQLYHTKHFSFKVGLQYKLQNIALKDMISFMTYIAKTTGGGSSPVYHEIGKYDYIDKPDQYRMSHSLGLNFDFRYILPHQHKNTHEIGLESNLYFIEIYHRYYYSRDFIKLRRTREKGFTGSERIFLEYYRSKYKRFFFVSALDLNLFYQYTLNFFEKFSLGFRASIGTNLYSDWNQFKKYVWVGFGVNFGFLSNEKVRLNKKMVLGEVEKKESM